MIIEFEFDTQYGTYKDAIHVTDDIVMTETEIEDLKQQRLNSWLSMIEQASNTSESEEVV